MKQYAVAVISLLGNENQVFVESAENELSAMKKAVTSFIPEGSEADFLPILNMSNSSQDLKNHLLNCEISISEALLIP